MTIRHRDEIQNPDSSNAHKVYRPRLTIRLLFVWITLSAIGIALTNHQNQQLHASGGLRTTNAMTSIAGAAQLTMMGVLLVVWHNNRKMLTHPGHWFAWVYSLGLAYEAFTNAVFFAGSLIDGQSSPNQNALHVFFGTVAATRTLFPIALRLYAATFHRGFWRWCFAFSILNVFSTGIGPLLSLTTNFLGGKVPFGLGSAFLQSVVSTLVLFTAISEYRNGVQRDFVHWVGVLAFTFAGVTLLVYITAQYVV